VALRSDSYTIHKILPNKVDPLVSLMMVEKVPDSTYEMVGGLDKQIKEIKEVIELPVKHPELFESLGIAQPKGVLLYGPPGTGKTLLARAVAHHTDCKFIRVSGSELVQKYIGEGSRMVRELFVMAREHAPSIIFMDEIDSIGSSRGDSGSGGGDSEVQRTMLELLNQLDGFEATKNIKVIMATNRIGLWVLIRYRWLSEGAAVDILDSALLRPGRIDRKIEFPPPGPEARVSILKIHSRKVSSLHPASRRCAQNMVILRCHYNAVLTSKHLPRKWDSAQVPKCVVYVQKQVRPLMIFIFAFIDEGNRYVRVAGAAAACYAGRL
jgi:26S proteasome regulatory subunit T6